MVPSTRDEISLLWRHVNRAIHDRFRHVFKGLDMPPGAMFLLRQIEKEPGLTISELGRRSDLVKSHVSKMVEQLERQGMVEKRTDPADQRLLRIYMTADAAEAKAAMEQRAGAAWSGVMEEIPEAQLAQVANGLRILLDALEKANNQDPSTSDGR